MIEFTKHVDGHTVTIEVGPISKGVVLYVDDSVDPDPSQKDASLKLKLALAARRLWQEALPQLEAGVYWCYPTTPSRRRVYIAAGWRPSPLAEGELVYFHKIPPLPEGWMNWKP